jgi:hypothetical protein
VPTGRSDRVEFDVPEPLHAGHFGGREASVIVGPGEWIAVADDLARSVPADPKGLLAGDRADAKRRAELAATCVEEALKFVPTGEDEIPEAMFRTERERELYAAEPGRFSKARLEAVANAYREVAVRLVGG